MRQDFNIAAVTAIARLATIPYFPGESAVRAEIIKMLDSMCGGNVQRLQWLVDTAANNIKKWGGMADLRGIYCSRFRPTDGIEGDTIIDGFRPSDGERRHMLQIEQQDRAAIASAWTEGMKREIMKIGKWPRGAA